MMSRVAERFLKYVKIDTQSDENSKTCPSTFKQFNLAKLLVDEMNSLGLVNVSLDENGYVMATLPSNIKDQVPVIGFISHMDTSPDFSSENIDPKIIKNYDGGSIVLSSDPWIELNPELSPELLDYRGQTLITTSGSTLLGADDKAGIAEIITAMEYLIAHREIPHGTIRVGFTPDEEIGRGADLFDVKKFGADVAYTIDGGTLGELEFENFNAAQATLTISGKNFHPGYAKNKMINAIRIAAEFNNLLPSGEIPEMTEAYQGFFHLQQLQGSVEEASMSYLIRDHDSQKFEEKKELFKTIVGTLNKKYGENTVVLELKDQYYNMRSVIEKHFYMIEIAQNAIELCGITPKLVPVRGGTDGSKLSFMELPCPNIFTGGHNFHGKYEYIPVESMEKAVEVIVKITELYACKKNT